MNPDQDPIDLTGNLEIREHTNAGAEGDISVFVGNENLGLTLLRRFGETGLEERQPRVRVRVEVLPD